MSAATVLVCVLDLLGRSAAGLPPIELVAQRPPELSKRAEAFVRPGSGIISLLTDTDAFRSAECGRGASLVKLASILAHEASHVRNGPSERLAYEAQLRALLRLGVAPNSRLYSGVQGAMQVAVATQERRRKQEAGAAARAPGPALPAALAINDGEGDYLGVASLLATPVEP